MATEILVFDKHSKQFVLSEAPAELAEAIEQIAAIARALSSALTVADNPYLRHKRVLELAIAEAITNKLYTTVGSIEPDDVVIENGVASVYARYAETIVRVTL